MSDTKKVKKKVKPVRYTNSELDNISRSARDISAEYKNCQTVRFNKTWLQVILQLCSQSKNKTP